MTEFVGIQLGGVATPVRTTESSSSPTRMLAEEGRFPPAVVMSLLPSAPPRFHDRGTMPLVGAGLEWPDEASADLEGALPGRVPVARLWECLQKGEPIEWRGRTMSAHEGLAEAIHELVRRSRQRLGEVEPCVIIPNALSESRQQFLLDALRRRKVKASFLWRPIAAALGWLESHAASLDPGPVRHEQKLGSLLSLHLGVDGFEACWLELIARPDSPGWILPARGRPIAGLLDPGGGRRLLEVTVRAQDLDAAAAWRATWASPAVRMGLVPNDQAGPVELWGIDPNVPFRIRESLARSLDSVLCQGRTWAAPGAEDLAPWLDAVRSQERPSDLRGAVVTGEYASIVGRQFASQLIARQDLPILVEDPGRGLLAGGAARFLVRRSEALPTYLDTLPRMETLVIERGQPVWQSLMQEETHYVDGGRLWRRSPRFGPRFVKAHSRSLDLPVWVESDDVVKQVSATFHDPPSDRVEVFLKVEAQPALGQANITVKPTERGALGTRVVELNWRTAKETNKTREQLSAEIPLPCPQVQERASWKPLARSLGRVLTEHDRGGPGRLSSLRDFLRSKPTGYDAPSPEGGIVAYGVTDSNGELAAHDDGYRACMEGLVRKVLSWRGNERWDALACLGYACFYNEDVQQVAERLMQRAYGFNRDECTFLGGCLRDPKLIAVYADRVADSLGRGVEGNNDRLKALWYMLQYREDATRELDSETAAAVVRACVDRLRESARGRRFKYLERHALVVLAFLTRRRIFDDDFLDPNSRLARYAKDTLQHLLGEIEARRLIPMRGSVNAEDLLERVIDFIDRRGSLAPLTA